MADILYDRFWVADYLDRIHDQKSQLQYIIKKVCIVQRKAEPEFQIRYSQVVQELKKVEYRFDVIDRTLRLYLENVGQAASILRNQCEEIMLLNERKYLTTNFTVL